VAQLAQRRPYRSVRAYDHVLAVVAGKDQGVVGEGEDLLVQRAVEVVGELLGPFGEVGTPDAVDEEGVTREDEVAGDDVDRRPSGVSGGVPPGLPFPTLEIGPTTCEPSGERCSSTRRQQRWSNHPR
jgi:hypothetical protein